jgi:hypothetical protein
MGYSSSLLTAFQGAFERIFNEDSLQNPEFFPFATRIVKIWSQMIVYHEALLYRDGYTFRMIGTVLSIVPTLFATDDRELASLIHACVGFLSNFMRHCDCRGLDSGDHWEDRNAIYQDFGPTFVSMAISLALALPTAFPADWRALGGPLVFSLAVNVDAIPELAPQLLTVSLFYSQIPEAEQSDASTNPTSFYGMAYVHVPLDSSQPRRCATQLFRMFSPEPALSFLGSQSYSEGLVHLLGVYCEDWNPADVLPFVSALPGTLPPFDELSRLRLLRWLTPHLPSSDQAILATAAQAMLAQVDNPLTFTVGVEILEQLLAAGVPCPPDAATMLFRDAEKAIGAVGMRALSLLAPHAPDVGSFSRTFISRACHILAGLWHPGATGWDTRGFEEICGDIAAQIRRPGCDLPFEEIDLLTEKFITDEPARYFAVVLEAAVALPTPEATALARRVLASFGKVLYVTEFASVLRAFVCAHPGDMASEIAAQMVMAMRSAEDETGVCAAAKVLAALIQSGAIDAAEIGSLAIEMIEGQGSDVIRGSGIELIASALAAGTQFNVPADVFEIWTQMTDRGFLATNYFRALTLAAFVAVNAEQTFGEFMAKILRNDVPINHDFYASNEQGLLDGEGMPILAGVAERFPGFVDGEQ